ncbi:MAG: quinone-dependent dihydroorotate dehydrogenase [Thermoleophilia bacterium]|jgi:dihydroorotate dehydrogenase|nr:quinone-dependent dihydroorotate dehydrogenase [Thermoleophilia bacterium]
MRLARPLLFKLDPERAHELALKSLSATSAALVPAAGWLKVRDVRLEQELMGLRFPNPVGLGAGYDKYAVAVPGWARLGFGFCEVGTVTAWPQDGNPKPRLFRLPEDEALINRMGFNNDGAQRTAARLGRMRDGGGVDIPVGVNIGKSKVADLERAASDYAESFRLLRPHADFVVVNVSSPNTPGLRRLQDRDRLAGILKALIDADRAMAPERPIPMLVKLAPDLGDDLVDDAVDLALELGLAGMVVANTTTDRAGLRAPAELAGQGGGLSGAPIRARATALVRRVAKRAEGRLVIVGVGGIMDADDAWEKITAGAALIEVWTALVYRGPLVAHDIAAGLLDRLRAEGARSIAEVVGSATDG